MGNQQTKKGGGDNLFTGEELKILETSFRLANGGNTEKITENKLVVSKQYKQCFPVCFCIELNI